MDGGCTSFASIWRRSLCCAASGWDSVAKVIPCHSMPRSSSCIICAGWNGRDCFAHRTDGGTRLTSREASHADKVLPSIGQRGGANILLSELESVIESRHDNPCRALR